MYSTLQPLLREWRARASGKVVCVGWPGVHAESEKERSEIERVLAGHDCIPVWPPRDKFDQFVNFCATVLWPVFHDCMMSFQNTNPRPFNEDGWAAYTFVNNEYAKAV